jgi:putative membrane protein
MKALYLSLIFICLLGVGCTPTNLSFTEAMEYNSKQLETEEAIQDAEFMVEAADYNLLLKNLSEEASEKAYSRIVTDFAEQNKQDHQLMGDRLRSLAKDQNVALPAQMSERHHNMVEDLQRAEKNRLDRIYLNTIEILHERLIRLYEKAALNANDAEVRSYAAAQLDIIRSHNRKLQEIRKELI